MIKGLNKLMNNLSEQGLNKMAEKPLKEYSKKVVSDAQSNAPTVVSRITDKGLVQEPTNVGQMISADYKNGLATINIMDKEVGYVEFGTGKYARDLLGTYDLEWKKLAFEFYVDGSGNTIPAPFIYPAVQENQKILDQELQKMLDKL